MYAIYVLEEVENTPVQYDDKKVPSAINLEAIYMTEVQ